MRFEVDEVRNPLAGVAITVDGPTASGKGTLAKALARRWRLKFLDTGAVYRAVALSVLKAGGDPADPVVAERAARALDFDFRHKGSNEFGVWLGGVEVTEQIRSLEAGLAASKVATQVPVRALLKDFQVNYAREWKPLAGVVLDGRDTGAKICPEAEVKLFLTADVRERGRRRWLEQKAKGGTADLEDVIAQVVARDAQDVASVIAAPVICPDAVVIDATHLDAQATLEAAIAAVEAKVGKVAPAPDGE